MTALITVGRIAGMTADVPMGAALNTGATSGGASSNARYIFAEMRDELDKALAPRGPEGENNEN